MAILVCGGAGYIGSHVVKALIAAKKDVVVVDNLVTGHIKAIDSKAAFYRGNLLDLGFMDKVFNENKIEGVIDFAAFSLVGESMIDPLKYFHNNFGGTVCLLQTMKKHNVNKIVFSSTAATYGEVEKMPITEENATFPTNPYGESKLCVEKMMRWCDKAYGLKYTALRYFNVAGAYPTGEIGEDHSPETHLIPIILQVALNKRKNIKIFGDDYPTKDGTCIRDYIHVMDLADAHVLSLERLINGGDSRIFNLGNGEGFSVREIIEIARKVTSLDIPAQIDKRRPGDPAKLVASSAKIIKELNWQPKYNTPEKIIKTAWNWHKNHPCGYEDK